MDCRRTKRLTQSAGSVSRVTATLSPFSFATALSPLKGQAAAAASAATSAQVRAHVPVPSQDAIKEAILKRKKMSLLKRLDAEDDEAEDIG